MQAHKGRRLVFRNKVNWERVEAPHLSNRKVSRFVQPRKVERRFGGSFRHGRFAKLRHLDFDGRENGSKQREELFNFLPVQNAFDIRELVVVNPQVPRPVNLLSAKCIGRAKRNWIFKRFRFGV